jgi:Anti-sigma-K factor rskA/Sigma-70, region 4
MATFDQLSAEQRAIIELVLQRGQSYDELSKMLGMPASRVRELAREALADLAPNTASRVDEEWRGQLVDYVLGQQSGPEAIATRGHLKRSEPARTWALSLLDSLEGLYANGAKPMIPDADEGGGTAVRPKRRETESATAAKAEQPARAEKRQALSPAARSAVLRRRVLAGVAGLALLGVLLFVVIKPFDDDNGGNKKAAASNANQTVVLNQALLRGVGSEKGAGIAILGRTQGRLAIQVTASSLKPTGKNEAYAVWLYNTKSDSRLVAAQVTDKKGRFVAVGALPNDYTKYKNIDISRQDIQGSTQHSGDSVLRGPIKAVPKDQQQQNQPGG